MLTVRGGLSLVQPTELHEQRSSGRALMAMALGHWLYKQRPEECFGIVRRFILGGK